MKVCTVCSASYSDRIEFCFHEGSVLVAEDAALDVPEPAGLAAPPAPNLPHGQAQQERAAQGQASQDNREAEPRTGRRKRSLLREGGSRPTSLPGVSEPVDAPAPVQDAQDAPAPAQIAQDAAPGEEPAAAPPGDVTIPMPVPVASDPVAVDPVAVDPVAVDPVAVDPVAVDSAVVDSVPQPERAPAPEPRQRVAPAPPPAPRDEPRRATPAPPPVVAPVADWGAEDDGRGNRLAIVGILLVVGVMLVLGSGGLVLFGGIGFMSSSSDEDVAGTPSPPPVAPPTPQAATAPHAEEPIPPPSITPEPAAPPTPAPVAAAAPLPAPTTAPTPAPAVADVIPPEPAPELGAARIRTEPPGARITIGGTSVGASPVKVDLPYGKHAYVASLPGYQTQRGEIVVGSADVDVPVIALVADAPAPAPAPVAAPAPAPAPAPVAAPAPAPAAVAPPEPAPAPAPAAAAAQVGVVVVCGEGVGSELRVDGRPQGTLPARVRLDQGMHVFQIDLPSGPYRVEHEVKPPEEGKLNQILRLCTDL